MLSALPPTGAPIRVRDVLASLSGPARDDGSIEAAFREISGRRHVLAVGSGRMAIALLLDYLKENDPRDRVVIPGYTCYTVAAAIARAGLKIEPAEVDPRTLDFDYGRLGQRDWSRVLAVVPSGLLGYPADLPRLEKLCRRHQVHLIDDAAQCLGARIAGRPVGSFGVAGVYSLARGKNVSAMGGGVLVTDSEELFAELSRRIAATHVTSATETLMKSAAYSVFLRPTWYKLATSLPFVEVGGSYFDPRFPFNLPSPFQRRLAARLVRELPSLQATRAEAAAHYRELLSGHAGINLAEVHEGAEAVHLRFPIRVASRARARIYRLLVAAGLGVSTMYPEPVSRIPGISAHLAEGVRDLPGANGLARSLLTLPTHPYVTPFHRRSIAEILRENLRDR